MDFEVDNTAIIKIRELRPSKEHGLRIAVHGGGCSGFSLSMKWAESPEESDIIIIAGDTLVFIDKKSSLFLNGSLLSYEDSLTSAGFNVLNKQFKSKCGCGSSF